MVLVGREEGLPRLPSGWAQGVCQQSAGQDSDFHLRQKTFSLCSCNAMSACSISAARILAQSTACAKGLAFAAAER